MGAVPAAEQWVRLEVPAAVVGLEGRAVDGMTFSIYGGTEGAAVWDRAGKLGTGPAERTVTRTRRQRGKVVALCRPGAAWSPRPAAQAVADIRSGAVRYVAVDSAGHSAPIVVVNGRHGPYLRTKPDATGQNNLGRLPAC